MNSSATCLLAPKTQKRIWLWHFSNSWLALRNSIHFQTILHSDACERKPEWGPTRDTTIVFQWTRPIDVNDANRLQFSNFEINQACDVKSSLSSWRVGLCSHFITAFCCKNIIIQRWSNYIAYVDHVHHSTNANGKTARNKSSRWSTFRCL